MFRFFQFIREFLNPFLNILFMSFNFGIVASWDHVRQLQQLKQIIQFNIYNNSQKLTMLKQKNHSVYISTNDDEEDRLEGPPNRNIQNDEHLDLLFIKLLTIIILVMAVVMCFYFINLAFQSPQTNSPSISQINQNDLQKKQKVEESKTTNQQGSKIYQKSSTPDLRNQKNKMSIKDIVLNFKGQCLSKDWCSPKKQLTPKDYQTLLSFGKIHFYALQKINDPFTPPQPPQYFNISLVKQYQQLPMCIIAINTQTQHSKQFISLKASIEKQDYKNYNLESDNELLTREDLTIDKFKDLVKFRCPEKSLVVLASKPFKKGALTLINRMYQQKYTWLTFYHQQFNLASQAIPMHGITSFYNKFFQRLPLNSIKLNNPSSFDNLFVALLQLGFSHAYKVQYTDIFETIEQSQMSESLLDIYHTFSPENYKQVFYRSIPYLSSNYNIDKMEPLLQNYIKLMDEKNKKIDGYKPEQGTFLTSFDIMRGLQNLGLKDLPDEHLLFKREQAYLELKYKLSQIKEEKGMCIVVLTYNNIEGQRYKHAIDTIIDQNYSNFHIVFIDDKSTDGTMEATKKRIKERDFDNNKIDYIYNTDRKYATYNIKNAGDNYCKAGQALVLIDGDDQIIGRNALKILNIGYSRNNNWVVYSSYFSTTLTYGGSKKPYQSFFTDQRRIRYYMIGPIRSFEIDLFRKIKQQDHKDDSGNFLPNYYDGALQYPLFQMAGLEKIEYIPEISYLYTINYHASDSKSKQHPRQQYQNMIYARQRYNKLDSLNS